MPNQQRLVQLFKDFFDTTCLPLVREHHVPFKEWLYFSTLLSQPDIDYQKLEKYIEHLKPPVRNVLVQRPTNKLQCLANSITINSATGSLFRSENIENGKFGLKMPTDTFLVNSKAQLYSAVKQDSSAKIGIQKGSVWGKKQTQTSKKPISKFISSLSGLHQKFSDNHRKIESRVKPLTIVQCTSNPLI